MPIEINKIINKSYLEMYLHPIVFVHQCWVVFLAADCKVYVEEKIERKCLITINTKYLFWSVVLAFFSSAEEEISARPFGFHCKISVYKDELILAFFH